MDKTANTMKFGTKKISILSFNIDSSNKFKEVVFNVLSNVISVLQDDVEKDTTVVVALNSFYERYSTAPFRRFEELTTDYPLYDGLSKSTALYTSITNGAENLLAYIDEVKKATGITPNASLFTFASSEYAEDCEQREHAKKSIEKLNLAGISTILVDLNATYNTFGDNMGYTEKIYAAKQMWLDNLIKSYNTPTDFFNAMDSFFQFIF